MKNKLLSLLVLHHGLAAVVAQPVITNQPQSQTNLVGATVTLSVGATGTPPLSYQWVFNSLNNRLPGATNVTLILPNVQASNAGLYRVVITNNAGSVQSASARLVVDRPLAVITEPLDIHASIGEARTFVVTLNTTLPHVSQWFFNGAALARQTNDSLAFPSLQTTNLGIYWLVVTSYFGQVVTSRVAEVDLYPPLSRLATRVFTNDLGKLPYRLFVPDGYTSTNQYPLVMFLHGAGEAGTDNTSQLLSLGYGSLVFTRYQVQARHPAFYLAPQHPSDGYWGQTQMAEMIFALLRQLEAEFSLDTNRLYVTGLSDGGYGSWDFRYRSPERFAAILPLSISYSPSFAPYHLTAPVWHFQAENDTVIDVRELHALVDNIRAEGGQVILTSYPTGGHSGTVWGAAYDTPPLVDWLMAQGLGRPDTSGPQIHIARPASSHLLSSTGFVDLSGSASAFDQMVTRVTWTNLQTHFSGIANGTRTWSARVPLQEGIENVIVMLGETTSWAASLGGVTTFNNTVRVQAVAPIRLSLATGDRGLNLTWSGGSPPYLVQQTTNLVAPSWTDQLTTFDDAVVLAASEPAAFRRVASQFLSFSVNDVILYEGDGEPTNAVFHVNLSAPATFPVSVDYQTEDATATAGSDYQTVSGTLLFQPGEVSKTISVPILGDTIYESPEFFRLRFAHGTNAMAPFDLARGIILDEDPSPIASIPPVTLIEGNSGTNYAEVVVTLSAPSGIEVGLFRYNTVNQTAIAGVDYLAQQGMLLFPPGTTRQTIRIPILGDTIPEPDETFAIVFSIPFGITLSASNQTVICTIRNDD